MKLTRLIFREIAHRKLNFALGVAAVIAAVATLIGATTLLEADQQRTVAAGAELQDSMRKITKGLGFNILVLPEDQDLQELHVEGVPSRTMPEEYVDRLANSKIITINHLLPQVSQKIDWPEANRTIILTGTRGEVPFLHRAPKSPLQDPVPEGQIVLGYQLHRDLQVEPGDTVTLKGLSFEVKDVYDERGTVDDATAWINLEQAQELFEMQNLVHAILALECNCASPDRITEIREEIAAILPGTQVLERGPPALARAEARNKASEVAEATLAQHESFAALLVPLVIVTSAVLIGLLAWLNVRHRQGEIGILRAVGLRSSQILLIFVGKALAMGLAGAALGYGVGFLVGLRLGQVDGNTVASLFGARDLAVALIAAPLLTVTASWLPAVLAARQDPAVVLQSSYQV